VERLQREYREDVDLVRLAADLVVDAVVDPDELRTELARRLAAAHGKDREFTRRRHGVPPV
jgi:acetyl-CoA carboxylase carboxyltransferase component